MAQPIAPQRPDTEPDANPGQQHEDDLFRHLEDQYKNPTGSAIGENAAVDRAQASLRDDLKNAEGSAAAGAAGAKATTPAASEQTPNYYYKPRVGAAKAQTAKEIKAAKSRSSGGNKRRGLFIGLGAGGGLLSVVAGFSALLPLKMPGIMDTLIDDAGKRIQQVVERRAERVLFTYILRGSTIALKNGAVIATGNPIGDLFANIRTSSFERDLKANTGLEFEPGPNKSVKLVHNGKDLGNVKNVDDILKILEKGANGQSLSRADIRKVIRTQIPAWRFFKRAKFVNWLRIKYNIPRYGAREMQEGENEDKYNESVKKEHIQQVESANIENLNDFVDCAAEAGDCPDRTGEGEKMSEEIANALEQSAEDLAKDGVKKSATTVAQAAIKKIMSSSVGTVIPFVGPIDLAARLVHGIGDAIDNGTLQKKHAEYIKRSTAVLGATYAGYADQTKAGDLNTSTVGMFSENFDGWEASSSYSIIQGAALGGAGAVAGTQLEPMEKANEEVSLPAFAGFMKTMFGTVGWIGRAPLEAWYYTVSQAFDFIGGIAGDAVSWIIDRTPAKALLEQLGPLMADIFTGIMKFVGMHVDPLAISDRLAMFIHQGFLGSFNDKGKEDGMRLLSESQALEADYGILQDHLADMKNESLYDRMLNLDDSSSLASTLVATMPTTINNPVATLASGSVQLVSSAPANFARATTTSAMAAPNKTSESLFGLNKYGGLPGDLAAELDGSVASPDAQCPPISDKAFNHCIVDRSVVESMKCVFVKCADMNTSQARGEKDYLFAYGADGPLYGPDAVQPQENHTTFALKDWVKANGSMLASLLPVAALEVTRRRIQ